MAVDYNVDRTDQFKDLLEWRANRINMYNLQAIEQRKRDEWQKIQQSHQYHSQQQQTQAEIDAQIREEQRLINIYQQNLEKNKIKLQESTSHIKQKSDFYQYYQQKIDNQNQVLDSKFKNLDIEKKALEQQEWEVQFLKVQNDLYKQMNTPAPEVPLNEELRVKDALQKGIQDKMVQSRFKKKEIAPSMDLTLPEHLASTIIAPNPEPKQVTKSLVETYKGQLKKPWEQKGWSDNNQGVNPFKNQRARDKWNRFMAKEGKSTNYDGQLNSASLGGYKRLDTYQRIYGPDKNLDDYNNDEEDINDREGDFGSPQIQKQRTSLLAKAGAKQLQTSIKKKKTIRFADEVSEIGGTPYIQSRKQFQLLQRTNTVLEPYQIYADDPSNPYAELTKSNNNRGNSLGMSQSTKVFDTIQRQLSQVNQTPDPTTTAESVDPQDYKPIKKIESYMDWLETKQMQQERKEEKFATKLQTSMTQQLVLLDDKKQNENNWSAKKTLGVQKLINRF